MPSSWPLQKALIKAMTDCHCENTDKRPFVVYRSDIDGKIWLTILGKGREALYGIQPLWKTIISSYVVFLPITGTESRIERGFARENGQIYSTVAMSSTPSTV